jgi:hypothetical protein
VKHGSGAQSSLVCARSKISVSSSLAEPCAFDKKYVNSFDEFRAAPSAMLAGIETAALRIWEVKPNLSSLGKDSVAL